MSAILVRRTLEFYKDHALHPRVVCVGSCRQMFLNSAPKPKPQWEKYALYMQ